MTTMASLITSLAVVYSIVYSGADQRKHQSSASLAFVWNEFLAERDSNAENVSIWWRHNDNIHTVLLGFVLFVCVILVDAYGHYTHPYTLLFKMVVSFFCR